MRDLLSQLTAIDPDATDKLQIIAFFDTLLEARAGLEAILRGAAALAGCVVGFDDRPRSLQLRVDAAGRRMAPRALDPSEIEAFAHEQVAEDAHSVVWLERGSTHASDSMILERCALVLRLTMERTRTRARAAGPSDGAAVEVLLDASEPADVRDRAADRLGLRRRRELAVIASNDPQPSGASVLLSTAFGPVYASVLSADEAAERRPLARTSRIGIGTTGGVMELPLSWTRALAALRLTSSLQPTQRWADLGAIVELTLVVDASAEPHPDEARIAAAAAEPWGLTTIEALTRTASIRSAAALLHLHHSSVQTRRDRLESILGFDIDTPSGRTRLAVAHTLYRLRRTGADWLSATS